MRIDGKAVRRIVCLVLAAVLLTALLAGCGSKLSGKYSSGGLIPQTFTFKGDNVTMSAFGITAEGTYKIQGDKIVITYSLLGLENTWEQSFRRPGKDIIIGGTLFEKE